MIRWGHSRSGLFRYRRSSCQKTFTPLRRIRTHRYLALFKKWILSGATVELLRLLKGSLTSERTLHRHFDKFLNNPPQPQPLKERKSIYLKVDGKYFGHWGCVLVFRERSNIIYWDFVQRENYLSYLFDLIKIKELGYDVLGATSDWHGSLVSAVKSALPEIPHQRCLVHTQRLCQSLLTKHPETEAGGNLLELVHLLNIIQSQTDKRVWIAWLRRFEERYGDFIKERTHGIDEMGKRTWWYTHKNLRRAFLTLKTSLPHLFIYSDNPQIGKDTNGLEAEFSHLVQKLTSHRGLRRKKVINSVHWYFYLKSVH